MCPSLLTRTGGGLPKTSTAGVARAFVIAVHEHIGRVDKVDVRRVAADKRANEKGWIGAGRRIPSRLNLPRG